MGPLVSEKAKRKAVSAHQIVQEVLSQASEYSRGLFSSGAQRIGGNATRASTTSQSLAHVYAQCSGP